MEPGGPVLPGVRAVRGPARRHVGRRCDRVRRPGGGLGGEAPRPLAAEVFTSDAGELPIVGTGEGEIPPPGRPWPELEAAEQLLEKYRTSLELMHKAAGLGGAARYPTDFSLGFNMLLDHAQNLRGGARLLTLEAHVLAHRG